MDRKPILCVDFDGVIHAYTSPWTNAATISDGPVPGALRWLWDACQHFTVMIYSSRSKELPGIQAMRVWLRDHSEREFGADHAMATHEGRGAHPIRFAYEKPAAFLTIDDRALCFQGTWIDLDPVALLTFKPWNKRS